MQRGFLSSPPRTKQAKLPSAPAPDAASSAAEFRKRLVDAQQQAERVLHEFCEHMAPDGAFWVEEVAPRATERYVDLCQALFVALERSQQQLSSAPPPVAALQPEPAETLPTPPSAAPSPPAAPSAEPRVQSPVSHGSGRKNLEHSAPSPTSRPPSAEPSVPDPGDPPSPQPEPAQPQQRAPAQRKRGCRAGKRVQARRRAASPPAPGRAPAQHCLVTVLSSVERITADSLRVVAGLLDPRTGGARGVGRRRAAARLGLDRAAAPTHPVPVAAPAALAVRPDLKRHRVSTSSGASPASSASAAPSRASSVTGMSCASPAGAAS